jgi:hypothetical protein
VRYAGVLLLLALVLTGCETNQERSAHLARLARHHRIAQKSLSITHRSADVHVTEATILRDAEGAAAVVTLRNLSSRTQRDVPIAITVKDARGAVTFQNNAPGLEAALTSVASLPAHGEVTWVDDQVPASGDPASVSAVVGVAPTASGSVPQLEVQGVHETEEPTGGTAADGTVKNRSKITQQNLLVYVIARRAGRIVAAGRAVLPEAAAGASAPFQAFFVGAAKSARLEASAPATTLE